MPSDAPSSSPPSPRTQRGMAVGRPLVALVGLGCFLALTVGQTAPEAARRARSASAAAAIELGTQGLSADANEVRWVDPPHERRGWLAETHRFLVVARHNNDPNDVWLGTARLSPEGRWLQLSSLYNLSDTSAVSETDLTVSGERIAWSVRSGDELVSVQVNDLKGQSLPTDSDLTWLERWQTRLTFLQETGQLAGLCRRTYRFKSPQPKVTLAWTDAGLRLESNGKTGILTCDGAATETLEVVAEPCEVGSPGDLVTWAVDRVRALPWFGTDRMQWVKAIAFGVFERLDSVKRRIVKSNAAAPLDDEVGGFLSNVATHAPDPVTGWPPAPMASLLTPALASEGVFRPLDDDPFAVPSWGGPSPFAFAFIRPDPTRQDSRIFVTLWDPRRLELHTMTGTREPKTATGETGSGTVPRNPAVVGRLAAAFNGGFQATHGEFGMMAQKVVYLPPKPFAATIAEHTDGTLGFGTWPNDEAIPDGMVGFRQNLTPLVSDGVVNPFARTWWGGVPPGWEDATRTVRTGLCLTEEQFVAYFYGASISAEHLAKAMVAARCSYGVHLDMNPGHTGFEFYRIGKTGTLPKIGHKLDTSWETRGDVPGATGWEFLGRRMLRTMHLMHFPRYVRTDSRDFFYLTHRYVLPPPPANGPARQSGTPKQQTWQTKDHAQQGFPPALATARYRPDESRPELELSVVVLDGKWLVPCPSNCPESPPIARTNRTSSSTGLGVYYHARRYVITETQPPAGAIPIAFGKDEARGGKVVAALGIAHGDWLFYAEVTRGADRARDVTVLKRLLSELGCDAMLFLEQSLDLSLGDRGRATSHIAWQRETSPMATRLFKETAIVPPAIWQPLQSKRVRYVRPTSASLNARPGSRSGAAAETEPAALPQPATESPTGDEPAAP